MAETDQVVNAASTPYAVYCKRPKQNMPRVYVVSNMAEAQRHAALLILEVAEGAKGTAADEIRSHIAKGEFGAAIWTYQNRFSGATVTIEVVAILSGGKVLTEEALKEHAQEEIKQLKEGESDESL